MFDPVVLGNLASRATQSETLDMLFHNLPRVRTSADADGSTLVGPVGLTLKDIFHDFPVG